MRKIQSNHKGDRKVNEKETNKIIQKVNERIDSENIKFLIWYGNRMEDDIDLLAVLKNGVKVRPYRTSKWDILEISEGEFEKRLKLFDPMVTEPVITGFLLLGNEIEFSHLRTDIFSFSPSTETIEFLRQRAHEELKSAAAFLEIYEQKGNKGNLFSALISLSFACSYFEFAKYYQNSPEFCPITFSHLLVEDEMSVLKEIMEFLKTVKSGRKINTDQVIDLFKKTQKLLEVVK